MKKRYRIALFFLLLGSHAAVQAQLNNGGINALFGVDADTRNNYVKYGPVTGNLSSDDWFSFSASGKNVIDTSGAAYYNAQLQSGRNMSFFKRMSIPLYSKYNGKLWLDAAYGRDYIATSSFVDSTVFTIAAKNGDNPNNWQGGSASTPNKNDLVDVFAHMRRDGTNIHDSLWFFAGVSTVGTSGSRYYDIELYKKNLVYDSASGVFSTSGTDAGHTQWKFDASGNLTQTGDMIVAVTYSPGSAPVVDVRIWVSSTTYSTVTPSLFNFGGSFNGSTAAFGYASIVSKAGTTAFGSGIANYSATAAQDTTFATPWGTENSGSTWSTQYQSLQFIEVGLNLTRMGVDPSLYAAIGTDGCSSLFSNIFFKSRSSASFTSNMQDFVGPLSFLRQPLMDFSVQPDTLRCNHVSGLISVTNNTTAGYYTWTTPNGQITGTNTDSSQINLSKAGTYIVSASPAQGCPATKIDTIIIPVDTFPPVATIMVTIPGSMAYLQWHGGDVAASNYATPFGGSKGLTWDWSGPAAFTSAIQNPVSDTAWGTYRLILTEKRNGCKDTAFHTVAYNDFIILESNSVQLRAKQKDNQVQLQWQDINANDAAAYQVEKKLTSTDVIEIGTVIPDKNNYAGSNTVFAFTDAGAFTGTVYYRIKVIRQDGRTGFSTWVAVNRQMFNSSQFTAIENFSAGLISLNYHSERQFNGMIVVVNEIGQRIQSQKIVFEHGYGKTDIRLSGNILHTVNILCVYENNQLIFSQKVW